MSWMPDFMWKRVIAAAEGGGWRVAGGGCTQDLRRLEDISTHEPVGDRVLREAKAFFWKVRNWV
jgi:hypothetical protein